MPRLRKTLPKDLNDMMQAAARSGDYAAVHAAVEPCKVDARGGYAKGTALMMRGCTPELARWFVARGVDLEAADTYGQTALHHSARARFHHNLPPQVLIDMGADVHARNNDGHTPLHAAVDGAHLEAVKALLAACADVASRSERGLTPLEYGLQRASNAAMVALVPVVQALLEVGAEVSEEARDFMTQAAERFEFHRAGFNKDLVEETAAAMVRLCELLGVDPPQRRRVHDGTSAIVAKATRWQDQHEELWELLVPSSGPCETVQGEVIRITGRFSDEMYRNGGGNWDREFRTMATAFCRWMATGNALSAEQLTECKALVGQLPGAAEPCRRLTELATVWVAHNPQPVPLPAPKYSR